MVFGSSAFNWFPCYSIGHFLYFFRNQKGFKSEWATVKDNHLYVGSMGKEWTTATGEFQNNDPQFVKVVSNSGQVSLNKMRYKGIYLYKYKQ